MPCHLRGHVPRARTSAEILKVDEPLRETDLRCRPDVPPRSFVDAVTAAGHDANVLLPDVVALLLAEFRCSVATACALLEGPHGGLLADDLVGAIQPGAETAKEAVAHLEQRLAEPRFRLWLDTALFEAWARD